jgi:hypothetical protein
MRDRPPVRPSARPALLPALGFWLCLTGSSPAQSAPASLTGRWTLNLDLSEQFEEKLQEAFRLGAFSSRATRGSGSGGGGTPKQVDDRELVGTLRPPLVLVIRQDDSTVAISDAGGYMVAHATDGRKVKEYLLSGETLEITAKWKDRTLIIERKQSGAGSVRETYAIDRERGKLVVTIKLQTATLARPLEFRRVYDPAQGS